MEEALEILRLVWGQEHATFDGRFYRFSDLTVYPRPVQRPRPPLWVAGVADAAVDRAARLGDGWLCGPVQSLSKAKACLDVYRRSCAEAGTEPSWILRRYAWVEADRRHVVDDVLPDYVNGLLAHWRESVEDAPEKALFSRIDAGEDVPAEEIAADRLLWGAPDDVIEQIRRYQDETGCTHIHAAFGSGLPGSSEHSTLGGFEEQAEMIRLFGREVIPAFAASAGG
jgi:alkanesulfonate monooxygenase SsuD/methylene tetrahydromethanopterin reductase-like flavin-dependent oxidoreductase (luciferase family)